MAPERPFFMEVQLWPVTEKNVRLSVIVGVLAALSVMALVLAGCGQVGRWSGSNSIMWDLLHQPEVSSSTQPASQSPSPSPPPVGAGSSEPIKGS